MQNKRSRVSCNVDSFAYAFDLFKFSYQVNLCTDTEHYMS
jgi:hypothetical protein